jgi:ribosomal protein S27AE
MQLTRSIREVEWNMSSITNLVCPNCGGAIAVRKDELRCQGRCGRDWRSVWDDLRSQCRTVLTGDRALLFHD